jgi:hypothetical protein
MALDDDAVVHDDIPCPSCDKLLAAAQQVERLKLKHFASGSIHPFRQERN